MQVITFDRSDIPYSVSTCDTFADHIEDWAGEVFVRIGILYNLLETDTPQEGEYARYKEELLTLEKNGITDRKTLVQAYAIATVVRANMHWMGDENFANTLLVEKVVPLIDSIRRRAWNCMDIASIVQALAIRIGVPNQIKRNSDDLQGIIPDNTNENHYLNVFPTTNWPYVIVDILGHRSMHGVSSGKVSPDPIGTVRVAELVD